MSSSFYISVILNYYLNELYSFSEVFSAEIPCGCQANSRDRFASVYFMSDPSKINNCIIWKKNSVFYSQERLCLDSSFLFSLSMYVHSIFDNFIKDGEKIY